MATTKFASIKARRIRVTAVDACGSPIIGTGACSIVSSGFVSVGLSAQVEDGQEFLVPNAWGDFCINEKDDSRVKRFDTTIEFCEVDPEILALLTGGRTFVTGTAPNTTAIGGTFGESVGQDFSLELWSKIAGGQCAGGSQWIYWALPHLKGGTIGDLTFENGPLSMTVQGAGTIGAGEDWGTGPYNDFKLPVALLDTEHIGYVVTSLTPPTDTDGCTTLTASTTATAGIPGTWGPANSIPPANVADLIAGIPAVVVASPLTAWTVGQYVQTRTAGTAGRAHWSSTAWVAGPA